MSTVRGLVAAVPYEREEAASMAGSTLIAVPVVVFFLTSRAVTG